MVKYYVMVVAAQAVVEKVILYDSAERPWQAANFVSDMTNLVFATLHSSSCIALNLMARFK